MEQVSATSNLEKADGKITKLCRHFFDDVQISLQLECFFLPKHLAF